MSPKARQAAHDLRAAFDLPPIQPHKLETTRTVLDPKAPKNMAYYMNPNMLTFVSLEPRSRWQRVKDWFWRLARRH